MISKSTLLGTLFGFLVLYLLGWAFYCHLASEFYESHSNVSMNNMLPVFIALGSLLFCFGLANLYRKNNHGGNPGPKSGFFLGAWVGFCIGFGLNILNYGSTQMMDFTGTLVDSIWCVFFYGLTEAAIGWAFKLTTPKKES